MKPPHSGPLCIVIGHLLRLHFTSIVSTLWHCSQRRLGTPSRPLSFLPDLPFFECRGVFCPSLRQPSAHSHLQSVTTLHPLQPIHSISESVGTWKKECQAS